VRGAVRRQGDLTELDEVENGESIRGIGCAADSEFSCPEVHGWSISKASPPHWRHPSGLTPTATKVASETTLPPSLTFL